MHDTIAASLDVSPVLPPDGSVGPGVPAPIPHLLVLRRAVVSVIALAGTGPAARGGTTGTALGLPGPIGR